MLSISCNLLNTVLQYSMAVWVQYGCKCMNCYPRDGGLLSLPIITRESHTTDRQLGKGSKFKGQSLLNAYWFCTMIKSKNCKSNHHKLRTICRFIHSFKNYRMSAGYVPIDHREKARSEKAYNLSDKEMIKPSFRDGVSGMVTGTGMS